MSSWDLYNGVLSFSGQFSKSIDLPWGCKKDWDGSWGQQDRDFNGIGVEVRELRDRD